MLPFSIPLFALNTFLIEADMLQFFIMFIYNSYIPLFEAI